MLQSSFKSVFYSLIKGLSYFIFSKLEANYVFLNTIASIEKGEQVNGLALLKTGRYYYLNGGITPSGYLDKYNTAENTISISEGGNSCGFVTYNTQKFWSGGHCYTIKIKNEHCNSKFLFFFLKYKEKEIMQLRVGSGLPNIQKKSLEQYLVPLPNYEKQCEITNILELLNNKKEIEHALLRHLQSQKQYLLSKMFI